MSRAFVKEDDAVEDLPDRLISEHPNYVTATGLAAIEAELVRAQGEHARAQEQADEVRFGATVTLKRDNGRRLVYRIVGEDEADPAHGTISHVSPLARALFGKGVGDAVRVGDGEADIVAVK